MNWEMTLSVERGKGRVEGRVEGEIQKSIRLILIKLSKGKSEEVIANEIEDDVNFVHQIISLSKSMENPTPEAILSAYETLKMEGKLDTAGSQPVG